MPDIYNLERFLAAQQDCYQTALAELRAGHKRSHWMWYIFPQLRALGRSPIASFYGISGLEEAKAYMENETLRVRLITAAEALLSLEATNPYEVMGPIDGMKLSSSMTLFEAATPDVPTFSAVLEKFYGGKRDENTLSYLREQ